jgi:hypothetical protein
MLGRSDFEMIAACIIIALFNPLRTPTSGVSTGISPTPDDFEITSIPFGSKLRVDP